VSPAIFFNFGKAKIPFFGPGSERGFGVGGTPPGAKFVFVKPVPPLAGFPPRKNRNRELISPGSDT